jgi:Uma2 family endonuclease
MSTIAHPSAPGTASNGRRAAHITIEKYEAMVASGIFTKHDRFELIEGNLVRKMTKNPPHSVTRGLCLDTINAALPSGWHTRQDQPVRIPDRDSEPEPDVSVARGERIDYLDRHPGPNDLALVLEVADSSVDDDRAMALTYGGGNVPVYWLVNIAARQLEVYTEPSWPSSPLGYRRCSVFHPGDQVALMIDGKEAALVRVADLFPPLATTSG